LINGGTIFVEYWLRDKEDHGEQVKARPLLSAKLFRLSPGTAWWKARPSTIAVQDANRKMAPGQPHSSDS